MKKNFSRWFAYAAGAVGLLVSSCAYDPYYADSGYGYSGGGYSSSVFISTGDSRWGYDPSCNSYYDYNRRAYYDPYLYGYYPVGYRPPIVYGVPHPHGWRPGSRYCPPPSRINTRSLSNYRDREGQYRRSDFSWRGNVRQRDQGSNFQPRSGPDRRPEGGPSRRDDGNRPWDQNRGSNVRTQGSVFDQNRQIQRPGENSRPDIRRPDVRNTDRSPNVDRSRNFDRSQFENRVRENRQSPERRAPSPGFNNPVTLSPQREAPQRPQFDRSSTRQNFGQQQARPTPQPQPQAERSRGDFNPRGGGGGGNDGERRGRR